MFSLFRYAVCFGLLFSVVTKLYVLLTDQFADIYLGFPKSVLWIGVAVELSVAVSSLRSKAEIARLQLFLLFSVFFVIALSKLLSGSVSCGCMGYVETSPLFILIIDSFVLVSLFFLNPEDKHSEDSINNSIRVYFSWQFDQVRQYGGVILGVLGLVLLFVPLSFGSTSLFQKAFFDSQPVSIGAVKIPKLELGRKCEVEVVIRNNSDFTVRVVGVARSCECVASNNLDKIPPRMELHSSVFVTPRNTGPFRHGLVFYLDHPRQHRVALNLVGFVIKRNEE